ncbi:prolyl hydroxylase family protein [Tundrisphaera sp. TA3]|uniref:prolyl hydroxylase family protein n=1 Tax=Tundrisphaera sp. TA3 TaxID=3435775 RepID=UPI003EBC5396
MPDPGSRASPRFRRRWARKGGAAHLTPDYDGDRGTDAAAGVEVHAMKSVLAENVFTVSGLLTPGECRDLIDRGEGLGFRKASVRTASGPRMRTDLRDNDRVAFADPTLSAALWDRCRPFVPPELEGGSAVGLDEDFRFYRYDVGQRFRPHRDGVVHRSPTERSRLTCLFYLNEGFAGGETVFYSDARSPGGRREEAVVVPHAGDALFFPHERWHEGRELSAGRKYVLRSDVFYLFPPS